MFANAFQSGFISIFYSVGSSPLSIWNKEVKNGHIRRVVDEEVKSLVLEIAGTNVATTYITCPQKPRASLAIKLPFLVMIIKNMKKYFTFEIQILDDKDIRRRFRVSNFQSTTKVRPFCTTMPIGLSDGWNQVQFNLADFTKRAYGSTYLETVRVQVHANVRIRRIYFSDTLYNEDEMPNEFRLFLPTAASKTKTKEKGKPEKKPPAKGPAPEEVPSGAPPSPVETAVPLDVPSPAPEPRQEIPEEPMFEDQPAPPEVTPEMPQSQEDGAAKAEPSEDVQESEASPEGGAEAPGGEGAPESEAMPESEGSPETPVIAEGEVITEEETQPEAEAPAAEDAQPDQISEALPEGAGQGAQEATPSEEPASEVVPVEEAPKED